MWDGNPFYADDHATSGQLVHNRDHDGANPDGFSRDRSGAAQQRQWRYRLDAGVAQRSVRRQYT
jgi:hypothetical protein